MAELCRYAFLFTPLQPSHGIIDLSPAMYLNNLWLCHYTYIDLKQLNGINLNEAAVLLMLGSGVFGSISSSVSSFLSASSLWCGVKSQQGILSMEHTMGCPKNRLLAW